MTKRQFETLEFIEEFTRKMGFAPTLQAIADYFEIRRVSAFERVRSLIRSGLVRRSTQPGRSLLLNKKGFDALKINGPSHQAAIAAAVKAERDACLRLLYEAAHSCGRHSEYQLLVALSAQIAERPLSASSVPSVRDPSPALSKEADRAQTQTARGEP